MHRSGTSAVTRVLNLLGLDLPERLYPPQEDNPLGFWEPLAVVAAHESFLAAIGSSYDDVLPIPEQTLRSEEAAAFVERLVGFLRSEFDGSSAYVIKDPRLARLVPLWLEAIARAGATPAFVLPHRSPLEVAASLYARNGFSTTKSLLLWLRHVLAAEHATRDAPRSFVRYENLVRDWRPVVDRIARDLDLVWPRNPQRAHAEIDAYLSPRHRHQVSDADELAARTDVTTWAKEVDRVVGAAADGGELDRAALDRVAAEVAEADLLYAPLVAELEVGLGSVEAVRIAQAAELDQLSRVLTETATEAERQRNELRRLESRVVAEGSRASAAEATHAALKDDVESLRRALTDRDDAVAAARHDVALLEEAHARREARLGARLRVAATEQRRLARELESAGVRLRELQAEVAARPTHDALSAAHDAAAAADDRALRQSVELSRLIAELASRDEERAVGAREPNTRPRTRRRAVSQLASWWLRPWSAVPRMRRYLTLRRTGELDTAAYLANNPDVAAAGVDPLMHYVAHGAAEGRTARAPVADAPALRADPVATVERSGLFDAEHYLARYPDVARSELTPLQHYVAVGWREGRDPNPYFDTRWYLASYADARVTAGDPLLHFIRCGDERRPSPRFDPSWYGRAYGVRGGSGALADYFARGAAGVWRSPVEGFDAAFYLEQNEDVRAAETDPFLHYLHVGYAEGRPPSAGLEAAALASRIRAEAEVRPSAVDTHDVAAATAWSTNPGPTFEPVRAIEGRQEPAVKAIAFYLPQFHAIPENDEWWGTGFTEWRNVARGMPRFAGHHQPRIPRDLGFYDLRDPDVMRRQIEFAHGAGLHGFCFYHYSFGGQRLLEKPVEQFLSRPELDLPFCLMWANENWTRTWDGLDEDVLVAQDYDEAHDVALVDDLQRHFADRRYIRVDGRPLLLLYRTDTIPDARGAIERWRRRWQSRHGEEPLILVAHAFGTDDPREVGADGAFQFPPHRLVESLRPVNDTLEVLDPRFAGHVVAYEDMVAAWRVDVDHEYPLVRTVVPGWDNEARRPARGLVVHGSTPERYEGWLREAVAAAREEPLLGESIVFVNAWNEWAEAAYLEPDVHHGAAYLNATARGLTAPRPSQERTKLVVVGHDAHRHGAQMILLNVALTLRRQFGCELAFHLLEGGALLDRFAELGTVDVVSRDEAPALYRHLRGLGYRHAIANTVVTGWTVPLLQAEHMRVVSLVHELPGLIEEYGLGEELAVVAARADELVVPSAVVGDAIGEATGIPPNQVTVMPQGLYREAPATPDARLRLRTRLGMEDEDVLVMGLGYGDRRKGLDLFAAAARLAADRGGVRFVWVGDVHPEVAGELDDGTVTQVGFTDDVADHLAAADAFFLSSREDPFPSVVLEAQAAGLPVVAFRGATGSEALIEAHGRLVEPEDSLAALTALLESARISDERRAAAARLVRERHTFDEYAFGLLRLAAPETPKISVVVPNFDYGHYLRGRLETIFQQTSPLFEVIVLDDGSTDDSLSELERIALAGERRFEVVRAEANSGSVFQQWSAACDRARGDVLWIAEADDLSDPAFLERTVDALVTSGAGFAFCDSVPVDAGGSPLAPSYKTYYRGAVGGLMDSDFVLDGVDFVRRCLAERNLVLNVSALVWRRDVLRAALDECLQELGDYRLAGDWHVYATAALRGARVAYVSQPLNLHRRHDGSVTGSLDAHIHLDDVRRVHEHVAARLDADEELRGRMDAYRTELASQLAGVNGSPSR